MKKNYLLTISVLSLLFIFASCEKNDNDFNNSKPKNPEDLYAKTEYNLDMRDFALAIDIAVNSNSSFKELVHKESIKQFDGAYDVVISKIANNKLTQDKSNSGVLKKVKSINSNFLVSDLLEDAMMTVADLTQGDNSTTSPSIRINRLKKVSPSKSIINSLIDKYPELQVSVPVHAEDLEDPDYIPPVAFISEEYEGGISNYMAGYNQSNAIVIDGINEPEKAVIVVGLNERLLPPLEPIDDEVPIVVPAPTNLVLTKTSEGIQLAWQKLTSASTLNTTGYIIERKSPNDIDFVTIKENYGLNNLVHFDNATEAGRYYSYRVRAFLNVVDPNTTRIYSDISNIPPSIEAPARPSSPKTFSVVQATSNYAELAWSTDPAQYISSTKIYKNVVGVPSYSLFNSYTPNEYHDFDTQIQGGQVIKYAIQNETSTGKSNILYDYIHVSYRDPSKTSAVRIKSIKCDGRSFEPWGMGPPEFRIKVVGGNKKDKTTFEIAKCLYCDFGGIDVFGWDETQSFNKLVYDWPYNLYETNYDVITLYLIESDHGDNWTKLKFTGKIGGKTALKLGIDSLANSPVNFNTSIDTEGALEAEYDFLADEDLGYVDYYYYEPLNKTLEFYYKTSTVYITLGQ